MTIDTLPLAGSLLLAIQHGPLVTVRIDGCEGEIVMGVDKWLALRAMRDVLRAADGEVARLREERDHAREKQRQAFYEMDCAHTERDHARWSAEIKEKAALAALSERDSLRSTVAALKQECERMRGYLAFNHTPGLPIRCRNCGTPIERESIARSDWRPINNHSWHCDKCSLINVSREKAKEGSNG